MAKVFWGVLLALLVFSGIWMVVVAAGMVSAGAMVQQVAEQQTQALHQLQQQELERQRQLVENQRRSHANDIRRRTLAFNQRCTGGVVIEVSGSTYTQLGSVGHAVRCAGRLADRPLRP